MSVAQARQLRKRLTPQEVKKWVRLRGLRPLGFHPRRQAPIGPYIADFMFRREKIVIEIDGGQHGDAADESRNAELQSRGYRVLRFWNVDVDRNLNGVMETILSALEGPA